VKRAIQAGNLLEGLIVLLSTSYIAHAGVTYHVDASRGADANSGTSAAAPWQTIDKVNRTTLNPGDTVLFTRGTIWHEELDIHDSGTLDQPITIADYGEGDKPLFEGGGGLRNGLHAYGQSYINVRNIAVVNGKYGFLFDGGAAHNTLDSVEASFSTYDGIGFQDPGAVGNMVFGSTSHDNGRCGVFFWSGADNGTVTRGVYYNNAAKYGSGVGVAASSNATVSGVMSYSNYYGIKVDVGATNVLVRDNTTYKNTSDGIDIDYAGAGIVVEKNTSYNNGEHGIDVEGSTPGTIVRYNITHNNGNLYNGGIMLDGSLSVQVYYNLSYGETVGIWAYGANSPAIYNNSVYSSTTCFAIENGASRVTIENNIAAACGPISLHVASDSAGGLVSNYNDWSMNNAANLQWGRRSYTLAQWQEANLQDLASIDVDPEFVNPSLGDFRLKRSSPAIAQGRNVGLTEDIFGSSVSGSGAVDLGAYQSGESQFQPPRSAQLVARHSGKCLDVAGISTDPGALVQQWSCWGGPNQQWNLTPTGDASYEITSVNSGMSLDVAGISIEDGAAVIQWPYWGGSNEKWLLQPISAELLATPYTFEITRPNTMTS